jgi:hypothetical protein
VLYACDETWWQKYYPLVATGFRGECWTISAGARDRFGLFWIYGQDYGGLSPARDYIHTGKNSGYQAIGLAHLFGAARMILVGFDMQASGGRAHWHGNHPAGLANGGEGRYAAWRRAMEHLALDIKRTNCTILNASRRTALKCFQRVTLETALHETQDPDRAGDDRRLPQSEPCAVR